MFAFKTQLTSAEMHQQLDLVDFIAAFLNARIHILDDILVTRQGALKQLKTKVCFEIIDEY